VSTALFTSKFTAVYLYGVTPHDPGTMAAAVTVLFATALIAGYLPARTAAHIDPTTALRRE
jgi:ABC-type antimicrobial peptide transport system permease subunit